MNMKRKFTLFALCALMLMLVLSACGGGAAESQPPQEDESPAVSQDAATTEAPDEQEETPEAPALAEQVAVDYKQTVEAIRTYQTSNGL